MRKFCAWCLALITVLVSLLAMVVFDFLLSLIYSFISRVDFLPDALDFIGEILDLGLTTLAACLIATRLWRFGHRRIEKLLGQAIEFQQSPISHINKLLILLFLAWLVFFAVQFILSVGDVVTAYTTGFAGLRKILVFFLAVKDTFIAIRQEFLLLAKIGDSAFFLGAVDLYLHVENLRP